MIRTRRGSRRFDPASFTKASAFVIFLYFASASGQTPTPVPVQSPVPVDPRNQFDQAKPISLVEAIDRAVKQISALTNADLNTRIANEDVRQARAALLPKITAPLNFIYTTPSLANTRPREPSFISADAVTVYQALLNAEGVEESRRSAAHVDDSSVVRNLRDLDQIQRGLEVRLEPADLIGRFRTVNVVPVGFYIH